MNVIVIITSALEYFSTTPFFHLLFLVAFIANLTRFKALSGKLKSRSMN